MAITKAMDESMIAMLRSMQMQDIETILSIEQSVHYTPWTRQQFLDSLHYDIARVLCDPHQIVGYIVFRIILEEMELLNIVVAQPFQKKGLGRQLLDALIFEAKKLDKTHIFLEVRCSNKAAIHLYESCGFCKTGLRKNYYVTETGKEDALIYQWTT